MSFVFSLYLMHILKCTFSSTKSYPPFSVEVGIMFVVNLLFFLLFITGKVNIACSIQTLILYMSGTSVVFICIHCLSG